jgi:hypothetical protein
MPRDVTERPTTHEKADALPLRAACKTCGYTVVATSVLSAIQALESHEDFRAFEGERGHEAWPALHNQ